MRLISEVGGWEKLYKSIYAMSKECIEKDKMRCSFSMHSSRLYIFFFILPRCPDVYPIRVLMLKPDAET